MSGTLIVVPDPSFTSQRRIIVELASKHRMPAIYPFRGFADEGGLIAHSVNVADQVKRSASYIDRILKGGGLAMSVD
jgi:putative tryptophan/tyrosine transport system substrate-binding protein